jgi:hypothetical protein
MGVSMGMGTTGRILASVVVLVLLAYVGMCLLLYWQQRSMIYFPSFTRVEAARTDFSLDRGDAVLRGWRLHPGKRDALIYFGGNAERIEDSAAELSARFADTTVYLVAYRGYGASDGRPSEPALAGDALALFDEVRRRHDQGAISVIGRSLGSGVASQLAARRPVSALVLVTPFDSLARVAQAHYPMFPAGLLLRDRYESFRSLPAHRGPLLIVRAANDDIVPPANTLRLLDALPAPPHVHVVERAGHNDLSASPDYWKTIAGFIGDSIGDSVGQPG